MVFDLWVSYDKAGSKMTSAFNFASLFKLSLADPKEAGRTILSFELTYDTICSIFAAAICASTAMLFAADALYETDGPSLTNVSTPWVFALMVGIMTIAVCGAISWTGQRFSGQGDFKAVFSIVAWLQVVQMVMQLTSLLVMIFLTPLIGFVQLVIFFWSLWIFVAFIDAAHGFDNMIKSSLVALLGSGLGSIGMLVMFIFMSNLGR
jgi:hypothetical protein